MLKLFHNFYKKGEYLDLAKKKIHDISEELQTKFDFNLKI